MAAKTNQRLDAMTRALLTGGVLAGPVYLVTAVLHGLAREGFDFARHSISLLSIGSLGWIQIANFLICGLLVLGAAVGLRHALAHGRGRLWGPLLVGVYGLGLIGAGVFVADPAGGFPPGTPAEGASVTTSGLLHFVAGGVGFLALSAACFVFAARFAGQGHRGWALYCAATGLIFLAGFGGIASGPPQPLTLAGFWAGLVLAWLWLSVMSWQLLAQHSRGRAANVSQAARA